MRVPAWVTAATGGRALVATGFVGVVLLAAAAGGGLLADDGPRTGAVGAAPATTGPATAGNATDDGGSGPPEDHVRPFGLAIESVEACGRTCRDVTASLRNNGGNPRANVTVTTEIRVGSTVVWEGSRTVGTLASGETATHTERVEVGLVDAARIERNDGEVTVVTVVRWDDGSATYRETMTVA